MKEHPKKKINPRRPQIISISPNGATFVAFLRKKSSIVKASIASVMKTLPLKLFNFFSSGDFKLLLTV